MMYLLYLLMIFIISCSGPPEDESMRVCFGGDVMLSRGVKLRINETGADSILAGVEKLFHGCDFVFVNLETPAAVGLKPSAKLYSFNADTSLLKYLKKAGITHCILANNHSTDLGNEGLSRTAENLKSNGIIPVGIGDGIESACSPAIIDKNGIKAAVFSSVIMPLDGFEKIDGAECPCNIPVKELAGKIKEFKTANPDVPVIVSLHWGIEYRQLPTTYQQQWAETLINSGADAIIGHHPHVIQTITRINGEPVFYSLGNLVFDQTDKLKTQALCVVLEITGVGLAKTEIHPIKLKNCFPVALKGNKAEKLYSAIRKISPTVEISEEKGVFILK